jgi:hypothetical protein
MPPFATFLVAGAADLQFQRSGRSLAVIAAYGERGARAEGERAVVEQVARELPPAPALTTMLPPAALVKVPPVTFKESYRPTSRP